MPGTSQQTASQKCIDKVVACRTNIVVDPFAMSPVQVTHSSI
jgi:hypothetical protein